MTSVKLPVANTVSYSSFTEREIKTKIICGQYRSAIEVLDKQNPEMSVNLNQFIPYILETWMVARLLPLLLSASFPISCEENDHFFPQLIS